MLKNSVIQKMVAAPLHYPYFDKKALRSVQPMSLRYQVACVGVKEDMVAENQLDPERIPEIVFAQYQAAKHIKTRLSKMKRTASEAAGAANINHTLLSKVLTGKRPFSVSPEKLVPFCYNVLEESCNKVMFGEDIPIKLPTPYSLAAKGFLSLPVDDQERIYEQARQEKAEIDRTKRSPIPNVSDNQTALIVERVFELTYDQGGYATYLFGEETPFYIRQWVRANMIAEQNQDLRMAPIMYIAFEMDTSLDYFVAENFTLYSTCVYRDQNEWIPLEDPLTNRFIGVCSSLPSRSRNTIFGEVIGLSMSL